MAQSIYFPPLVHPSAARPLLSTGQWQMKQLEQMRQMEGHPMNPNVRQMEGQMRQMEQIESSSMGHHSNEGEFYRQHATIELS